MVVNDDTIEALMDQELGAVAATPPVTTYIGLVTSEPDPDGTGYTEVTGGGYARLTKTNNTTNWPACTPGTRQKSNGVVLTFPTATGSQGTVVGACIFYASSGGDAKWFAPMPTPEVVNTGNVVSFAVGQLKFTCLAS
jgi:hypothetical protein